MKLNVWMLEAFAVVKTLTVKRLVNSVIVAFAYLCSILLKNVKPIGKPVAFSVEGTNICNLKCPECPTGAGVLKRSAGMMTLSVYKSVVDQLSPELMYLNLYVQGEPLLHPHFSEMVKYGSEKGIYVSVSTNGHFVDKEKAVSIVQGGLTRIIFSVDGITQESYEKYRVGGDLGIVLSSIRNVIEARKELKTRYPIVVIQFLVFSHNESELKDIERFAGELGVDKLEIKTAQLNSYGRMDPPANKRYSRYGLNDRVMRGRMINRCWRQWHSAVITWDGKISPCCYDKDLDYVFGDVNYNQMNTILGSRESLAFKKQINDNKKAISICQNCPEGRK